MIYFFPKNSQQKNSYKRFSNRTGKTELHNAPVELDRILMNLNFFENKGVKILFENLMSNLCTVTLMCFIIKA